MYDTHSSSRLLLIVLTLLLGVGHQATGQGKKDPHRPACTSVRCRKIKSFLKARYCGESSAGNGPDDGCEIRPPKKHAENIEIKADFDCEWIEGVRKCEQRGQLSSELRSVLTGELRRLGLPTTATGQIYFTVWGPTPSGWSLTAAHYDYSAGDALMLCQVIAIIDKSAHVHILRKVPFQKTDRDVPTVTTWTPVDVADVDGDEHIDVILEGDAYEDHWLEVDSVEDGVTRTIFSGLGYYL
jgi:hypothetical protein